MTILYTWCYSLWIGNLEEKQLLWNLGSRAQLSMWSQPLSAVIIRLGYNIILDVVFHFCSLMFCKHPLTHWTNSIGLSLKQYSKRNKCCTAFLFRFPKPSICLFAGMWMVPCLQLFRSTSPGSQTTYGQLQALITSDFYNFPIAAQLSWSTCLYSTWILWYM